MSTKTIEQLQQIVANETLSEEDRRQAAEHILKLQQRDTEPTQPADPALTERRAHFTGAQHRLAHVLSLGDPRRNLIDRSSDVPAISDKLTVMQIVRLMLDDDGNDAILHSVYGWNSKSMQSLADRMGDQASVHECNPQWRLGMQSVDKQQAYLKRQVEVMKLKLPILPKPEPELRLDAKALVRTSSQKFAEFVLEFHRKVLGWDLKQFLYENLKMPGTEFFPQFIGLQKRADAEEESLFKNAAAAHMLATDPDSNESDAEAFLDLLAWVGQRSHLEDLRRQERIARHTPRSTTVVSSQTPAQRAIKDAAPQRSPLEGIDLKKVATYYDNQLAEIDAELEQLKGGTARLSG